MDPVISTMILQTKVLANIIKANVRTVDGKTYGEMMLQIPNDEASIAKVKNFLSSNEVTFQQEV